MYQPRGAGVKGGRRLETRAARLQTPGRLTRQAMDVYLHWDVPLEHDLAGTAGPKGRTA